MLPPKSLACEPATAKAKSRVVMDIFMTLTEENREEGLPNPKFAEEYLAVCAAAL